MTAKKDWIYRVSSVVILHFHNRVEIEEVRAGDICAVIGLKNTTTGDTLTSEKNEII